MVWSRSVVTFTRKKAALTPRAAAGLQHCKGARLHVAADEVDHSINVVDQGLEWRAFAREHLLGAKTADERQVLLRACCHHPDACLPGELDRERTDIAGRSVDQHPLSAERGRLLEQRLPGGDCDDRNGSGVDVCLANAKVCEGLRMPALYRDDVALAPASGSLQGRNPRGGDRGVYGALCASVSS
jgi:hypothetical protein